MQAEAYDEHVGSPVHSPVLTRSASGTSVFSAMSVQSGMSQSDPSVQGASVPHNRLRCSRPSDTRRPRTFRASRKPSHNLTVQIPHSHSMGLLPDEDAQTNFPPDIISPWSQDSTYSPLRSSTPTSELTGVINAERQRQRYQMHAVLGGSIFGQVVAATDLQTGTPVAIKLSNLIKVRQLYQQMSQPSDVLENPLHEAQLMRVLSGQESGRHPYVLNLLNEFCTENGNLHWMVLEYAPNKDLFEMVLQAKHFPDNMARHYFLQVLSGVHFIHQHGICHLDLSLENLLLDDKWNVKICDFGVARPLPRDGSPFPPMRIHSKVRYMAPELLSVSQFFDGRQVDIFSLGVILYCLLVGHPPFESAAETDQAYQLIASGQLRKLLQMVGLSDRCSDSAADLISRMVCPADRRITMRDILAHPWLQIHQAPPVALLPPTIIPSQSAMAAAPPAMPVPLPNPQQVVIQPLPAPQQQPAVLSIVNPNAPTKPGSA